MLYVIIIIMCESNVRVMEDVRQMALEIFKNVWNNFKSCET